MIKDLINTRFGIQVADPRDASAGSIVLANVANSAKATRWISDYNVGLVQNNGLVQAREHLAPTAQIVAVNETFSYRYFDRAESFKNVDYDKLVRGTGGEHPYFNAKSTLQSGSLESVGISVVIEKAFNESDPSYEARMVQSAINILETATLQRAYEHFTAIAAATTWSKTGEVDPDTALFNAMDTASSAAGVRPNRVLYGDMAWTAREIWLRSKQTAAGFNAPRDEAGLSSQIRADVMIPDGRIANGSGMFPAFAADKILGGVAFAGTPEGDVSNVKLFVGKDGLQINEWDHPQGHLKIITVSRWQCLKTTSALGAFAISVTA